MPCILRKNVQSAVQVRLHYQFSAGGWITQGQFTAAPGLEVKPEGACFWGHKHTRHLGYVVCVILRFVVSFINMWHGARGPVGGGEVSSAIQDSHGQTAVTCQHSLWHNTEYSHLQPGPSHSVFQEVFCTQCSKLNTVQAVCYQTNAGSM